MTPRIMALKTVPLKSVPLKIAALHTMRLSSEGPRIGALSWPDPGLRALEAALATTLAFAALVLRSSRFPSFPSLPRQPRSDPLAIPWASVQLRRPNVPESVWAALGGLVVAVFVGGSAMLPAGLLGAVGTLIWLNRRRGRATLRERARLTAQVPPLADLFAAGLAAGLQPAQAAATVAQAFGRNGFTATARPTTRPTARPTARPAARLAARTSARPGARLAARQASPPTRGADRSELAGIDLLACRFHDSATAALAGADPEAAWSALAQDEATAPLAAAVIRASRTGAPAATTVGRAARELRDAAADVLAAEVRAVGVRATTPLALCFLPAFVFLGVLPTALGLLPRLRG